MKILTRHGRDSDAKIHLPLKHVRFLTVVIILASLSTVSASRAVGAEGIFPSERTLADEIAKVDRERHAVFGKPSTDQSIEHVDNLFPRIATPPRSEVDPQSMAKRYQKQPASTAANRLLIFASFTMPKESLRRMIHQANRIGATVVMRGFKDRSLQETARAIEGLGVKDGNVQVDPQRFDDFGVTVVPTFVLLGAPQRSSNTPEHVAIAGDVTLDYALTHIVRRDPACASLVDPIIGAVREEK